MALPMTGRAGMMAGVKGQMTWIYAVGSAIVAHGKDRGMARTTVEIGQSFHKTGSPWFVWIVDGINENIEPMHVRLTRVDDPTTHITVSVDVLTDPRHFQRPVPDF